MRSLSPSPFSRGGTPPSHGTHLFCVKSFMVYFLFLLSNASGLTARVSFLHIIKDVLRGVFRETFKAGIGGPSKVRRQDDIVQTRQWAACGQRLLHENVHGRARYSFFS